MKNLRTSLSRYIKRVSILGAVIVGVVFLLGLNPKSVTAQSNNWGACEFQVNGLTTLGCVNTTIEQCVTTWGGNAAAAGDHYTVNATCDDIKTSGRCFYTISGLEQCEYTLKVSCDKKNGAGGVTSTRFQANLKCPIITGTPTTTTTDATTTATTTPDTFTAEVPLPGQFDSAPIDNNLAGKYIRAAYIYLVWAVGLLAVVMITFGGVKWVAAAGNPGQITEAKDIITSSIIGIIITLTSVLILTIINPDLIALKLPDFSSSENKITAKLAETAYIREVCDATSRINCGYTKQIGTVDVDGKSKDRYCMGTTCPRGGVGGIGEKTRICQINVSTSGKSSGNYLPNATCVEAITLDSGQQLSISQTPGAIQNRAYCGSVNPNVMDVGGWCDGAGFSVGQNPDPQCYLSGSTGKVIQSRSRGGTIISNLCCPGKPCPQT